ncbi:hypothetical protein [Chitinophaga sancti]|uniref:Uncharacterized protein n=1 Tax=Chitinophaga sancti TaxID=1004 RepID=A0A1K1T0Y3_9BACT|nr:hypothetical protein [Chitinophaga sancti]WQD63973.1 hypothetical protein U0033_06155 [Chitinophaga sancti]WQG90402.1 hypothetical protein SR876_02765 [Chitinophaga sancti]SFW90256.1 hypothetical protein SAMN05661012_06574 [Chitinophaga sancti]
MKKYENSKIQIQGIRKSKLVLSRLSLAPSNETGVAITTYGQGQVTGALYTVPAHAEITVDFKLKLICVTPEDVQNLNNLIKSLLDASHQHLYDELSKTEVSGGASFFGLFGWGGASASYSNTKHTMDSFGLSERNQEAIVDAMMKIVTQPSEFNYSGTIHNKDYDYDVTGNIFGIVMDAVIQQNQFQRQIRFLAPNLHLESSDGTRLNTLPPLYQYNN